MWRARDASRGTVCALLMGMTTRTQTHRFRVGCGAPADSLAEELTSCGFLPTDPDACEELGDYCVVSGTDAEIEQLCDDIGGMAMALDPRPEEETELPDWIIAGPIGAQQL